MIRGWRKPVRPVLYRGHPLARGLVFAVCAGWDRGFASTNGLFTRDEISLERGDFRATPGTAQNALIGPGRALASDVDGSNTIFDWNRPTAITDITHGFSALIVGRFNNPATTRMIFSRRSAGAAANAGWSFEITSGSRHLWTVDDGVAETQLTATDPNPNVATEAYITAATYTPSSFEVFVDGMLEASSGAPVTVGNPAQDIRMFGGSGATGSGIAEITVAYFWTRKIPRGAIAQLTADPYVLWKRNHEDFMFGYGSGAFAKTTMVRRKPVRPTPVRSRSLWRQCVFASAVGWNKGWTEPSGQTTYDDQKNIKGVLQGSRPGTHTIIDAGRALASGVSNDPIIWTPVLSGYDAGPNGFSVACVVKPATVPAALSLAIFSKRVDVGGANAGWSLIADNAPFQYVGAIASGGVAANVASQTAPSIDRSDMLVMTYDRVTLKLFVNGKLEDTQATAIAVGTNASAVALFNFNPTIAARQFDGDVSMAAIWNRELLTAEISQLYSDPYIMWKGPNILFGPGMAPVVIGMAVEDCCCPCCGGPVHVFGMGGY